MNVILAYFSVFICGIVLQFGIVRYFSLYGVAPDVLLVSLIFISLVKGPLTGQLMGFFWGLAWDVIGIDLFGSHAFLYTTIGYFTGLLSHKWNESKLSSQMILTFTVSLFFLAGRHFLYKIFAPSEFGLHLNYILILQPVYNTVIAPLVFLAGGIFASRVRFEQK
ncbi:MAG: rod shape-determining protein MreD [Endomicrobiales bacterium]|nr:rod shape-determining protein MreD [Endomicrobiales bacterium]